MTDNTENQFVLLLFQTRVNSVPLCPSALFVSSWSWWDTIRSSLLVNERTATPHRRPPLLLPVSSSGTVFGKPSRPRPSVASWRSSWRPRCSVASSRRGSSRGRLREVPTWKDAFRVYEILFLIPSFIVGLFEVRVQEYLDSIRENEHRRVNRFLLTLGKDDAEPLSCSELAVEQARPDHFPLKSCPVFSSFSPGNKMKFLSKK